MYCYSNEKLWHKWYEENFGGLYKKEGNVCYDKEAEEVGFKPKTTGGTYRGPGEEFTREVCDEALNDHDYVDQDGGNEQVDHPPHYNRGNIECWDYIEDQGLGFLLGNVVKYIARAGHKETTDKLGDLRKARNYLDRYIAQGELLIEEIFKSTPPSTIMNDHKDIITQEVE